MPKGVAEVGAEAEVEAEVAVVEEAGVEGQNPRALVLRQNPRARRHIIKGQE